MNFVHLGHPLCGRVLNNVVRIPPRRRWESQKKPRKRLPRVSPSVHRKEQGSKASALVDPTGQTTCGLDDDKASQFKPVSSPATSEINELFSNLPTHCRIPAEDIIKMRRHSKSIGNFAGLLTMWLFQELFTQDNLRFRFHYNENGHS